MSAPKKFTTRGEFKPFGRTSNVFGEKTSMRYEGGGFCVEYSVASRKKGDELTVTVTMRKHQPVSWKCMDLVPSPEIAKIHAGAAFRTHFKVGVGDPQDFEGRELGILLDRCPCLSEG